MKSPNRDRDIKRSGWYRTIPIRIATQNYELCLPTPNSRSEAAPSGAFPTPDSRPYLSHSTVYGIISVQLDLNSYIFNLDPTAADRYLNFTLGELPCIHHNLRSATLADSSSEHLPSQHITANCNVKFPPLVRLE